MNSNANRRPQSGMPPHPQRSAHPTPPPMQEKPPPRQEIPLPIGAQLLSRLLDGETLLLLAFLWLLYREKADKTLLLALLYILL